MDSTSTSSSKPAFKERLPDGCPPKSAEEAGDRTVIRLVSSKDVSPKDFHSHGALGKVRPSGVCECRWLSCSVYCSTLTAAKIRKLPVVRKYDYLAIVKLNTGAGRILEGRNSHLDFWAYDSFEPSDNVTEVQKIEK